LPKFVKSLGKGQWIWTVFLCSVCFVYDDGKGWKVETGLPCLIHDCVWCW